MFRNICPFKHTDDFIVSECLDISNKIHASANHIKYRQKGVTFYPNTPKYTQIHSNTPKYTQIHHKIVFIVLVKGSI